MTNRACALSLFAVIALSAAWTGWMTYRQRPVLPVGGALHRATVDPTVDRGGHSRGIVQVDLMRQILAERARAVPAAAVQGEKDSRRVRSQSHPLLGRPAPALVLSDTTGKTRDLGAQATVGPVVVVFYLGSTCMACMTHLVELEAALPRFRERGAEVWAVSADPPELTRERMRRIREPGDPALERPGPYGRLGIWRVEADSGLKSRRRGSLARDVPDRSRGRTSVGPTSPTGRSATLMRCWPSSIWLAGAPWPILRGDCALSRLGFSLTPGTSTALRASRRSSTGSKGHGTISDRLFSHWTP